MVAMTLRRAGLASLPAAVLMLAMLLSPQPAAAAGLPAVSAASAASAASSAAESSGLVAQIATRLAQAHGVRAQFTQTQTLAALQRPLVSTGSLLLVREHGMIWRMATPYPATYVINGQGVTVVDAQGRRVDGGPPRGARGVADVSRMMSAMLGGDLSALYTQFDVQAEGSPAQWRLRLTPNQPQLAQAIQGMQLSGAEFLQSLRITLANGDITQIDFSHSSAAGELTPLERNLLGAP